MARKSEQTKERILNAAIDVFAEKGYSGARVDAIAELAEANKQRIYAYYGSKSGLFEAVMKDAFTQISTMEEDFLANLDGDPDSLAKSLLQYYIKFHADRPNFWRLLAWENLEGGEHAPELGDLRKASLKKIKEMFLRMQKSNVIKNDVSFESYMLVLWSVSFFYNSNMKTVSSTLDTDLSNEAVRNTLVSEISSMLA
jgi:AcrR family transcriptional regulator